MLTYFAAVVLLSAGSFIHTRSAAPEMRPASAGGDILWRWLARAAFAAWLGLLVWGFVHYHWSQPVAALLASLAANGLIAQRGPMRTWPGVSMIFCLAGLLSAFAVLFG
jgi:hypothetical protein